MENDRKQAGYPQVPGSGPDYGYAYDIMGRLNTMTNVGGSFQMVTGTTYDPANRLLSISGNVLNETREYNTMGQLTQIVSSAVSGSSLNITYNYSSTQNNGKITSQTDNISGEQVVYAYDALNRLASAAATNSSWGQSYAYDGFGNLTDQIVTAGTAPSLSVVYNASNNQQTTDCADANGNILVQSLGGYNCNNIPNGTEYTYDIANRLHPPTLYGVGTFYSYAPGNKRVWRGAVNSSSTVTMDEVTFWSVTGQKLATFSLLSGGATLATANAYFGGRLIANNAGNVATDRLGSVGKYYPWGQEKPSATTNGTEKFTGYFRDAETGLDYANNRYHQPGMGRFLTPDPYLSSAALRDPGSLNRYAYTRGDPINRVDRAGLDDCDPDDPDPSCFQITICAPGMVPDQYGNCGLQINPPGFLPTPTNPLGLYTYREFQSALILAVENQVKQILTSKSGGAPIPQWPVAIQIMSICPGNLGTDVTYQIISNTGQVMTGYQLTGDTIAESFSNQTGNLGNLNRQAGSWSYPASGTSGIYTNGQFGGGCPTFS